MPSACAILALILGQSAPPTPAPSGERIFAASCATCHSLQPGVVRVGPSLRGALDGAHPRKTPAEAEAILRDGRNKMSAYGSVLSPAEIDAVVRYLRELP